MEIIIRKETAGDHKAVFDLVEKAFKTMKYSDHQEQFLVERLRKSNAFIPELSLVAAAKEQIIGFILLTKIHIKSDTERFDALALAPVAVLPEYQSQGIGGKLIKTAHQIARNLGHQIIVLLGHAEYYPRFGYEIAENYGIRLPFDVPKENAMVLSLTENGLNGVSGEVVYSKPFWE